MMKEKLPITSIVFVFLAAIGLRMAHIFYFFDKDWEMDAFCHILKIEGCLSDMPYSLWNILEVWAKPVYTAFFALIMLLLPENIRFLPVIQIFNVMFWCMACFLLLRALETSLREKFDSFAKIAFLLVALFTFVPFRGSVSANTEPVGALIICISLYFFQKRHLKTACFFVGFAVLARIDVLLMTAVQICFSALSILSNDKKIPEKIKTIVLMGIIAILPAFFWSLLGYFWKGNFFLILNTYHDPAGTNGYGYFAWYYDMFFHTDKAFTVLFCLSPLLFLNKKIRSNPLFLLCFIQSAIYYSVMSFLWMKGYKGNGGLQRYAIIALPYFLVCIGFVLAQLFELCRTVPRTIGLFLSAALGILLITSLYYGLKPLTEKPVMHSRQWTAIGGYDSYYNLQNIRNLAKGKTIYTDAEGVVYYLRSDRKHPVKFLQLTQIKNPDAKGIFVYSKGWSEHYSHLSLHDFIFTNRLLYQENEQLFVFER